MLNVLELIRCSQQCTLGPPGALFSPNQKKKKKKIQPEKNSLYFRKRNFLALILKKCRKRKSRKKFFTFQETEALKKLLTFQETKPFSPSHKKLKKPTPPKKFLIFREMELSNSKSKKFLIFSQPPPPRLPQTFRRRSKKLSLKKFLIFFPKRPALKKCLLFS